ncbi:MULTISPECIES: three component ABC system middle component [unclassified Streptomyces]|uniref:three component ABC system middle component n=1 Tax=unclassified Streptomyces TaxID=2593676 RepID=UPI00344F8C80
MNLSREERALYNPAFTGLLCTRSVQGYAQQFGGACPLHLAVVAGIMALQPSIRAELPRTMKSGLMKWLDTHESVRIAMARNAPSLAAVVRPGVLFALQTRALTTSDAGLVLAAGPTTLEVTGATEQTIAAQRAALFLGRWLPSTGSLTTVLTLLGVKP